MSIADKRPDAPPEDRYTVKITGTPDWRPEHPPERCLGPEQPRDEMPEDLTESVSGSTELVFPDDAGGKTYRLRERSVYDAEEVRAELDGDVPQYGSWLPVKQLETGDDAWLTAPSQLRSILVEDEVETGERFEIESMRKRGTGESDPYEVKVLYPGRETGDDGQTSLSGA